MTTYDLDRREFLKVLGAGILITVTSDGALGGGRGGGGFGGTAGPIATRVLLGKDGTITAMSGKVELGQGARTELSQAVAEELRVPVDRIQMILADTDLVPDDGITAGSQTTPNVVPQMRRAGAAARELLTDMACRRWQVDRGAVEVRDGVITEHAGSRKLTYADLAQNEDLVKAFAQNAPPDIAVTPVKEWKILGTSSPKVSRRDVVTGANKFGSDIVRPNMLYGKVLRAPSYGATLAAVDLAPAKAMEGVVAIQEGQFVGCAAPNLFRAEQALAAIAKTATWKTAPHPSNKEIFSFLRAQGGASLRTPSAAPQPLADGKKALVADFEVPYIQHAPMETRAGVAEWSEDRVTVWLGCAAPFNVRRDVANTLRIAADRVHVIVQDTGGAFGGKHTGEAGVEAARLARAAQKPVCVKWTREEEFTWALFRPAGLIQIQAELDASGSLTSWNHVNINSGAQAIQSPYNIPVNRNQFLPVESPLRQGSYRALAATANNFAREAFMSELAAAAGKDPLAFRLAHLKDARMRAVLEAAAKDFRWADRRGKNPPNVGVGIACGTEKNSYVATCVEAEVDRKTGAVRVRQIHEVFECGAVLNPANMVSQVQGCIVMGMGAALREEIRYENGKILTAGFDTYLVPRFADVPPIEVRLLDRSDLASAGGGETPIIGIAPAIAEAVYDATRVRIRRLPITDPALKQA
jgi:isoquinoline 1-oxidoreductase subunit beta